MARKNPFENLMDQEPLEQAQPELVYVATGASRSIMNSIDELADKADKLLEGETIVELDPDIVDPSFLKDRIEDDEEEFEKLLQAIKEEGQTSPILVRPHPLKAGRYMVVFGARRCRVAKRLGTTVRAVIKDMGDRDHAVAQGQENAARANLSFVERAMLAAELARLKYDADNATVLSALSIDKATLSKMLSVANISPVVLNAVGAAKSVGRDRWYALKTLMDKPANLDVALACVSDEEFLKHPSVARFNMLYAALVGKKKPTKARLAKPREWTPGDKAVAVDLKTRGKTFTLSVKAKNDNGVKFGEFISENLEPLYEAFKQNSKTQQGE